MQWSGRSCSQNSGEWCENREYKERTGFWPRRKAISPPGEWATPESFHEDVLAGFEKLVVSHRPVKRRLAGAFHEEQHYGPVLGPLPAHRAESPETLFTNRIPVYQSALKCLKPNHLRVPEGWDELSAKLADTNLPKHQMRGITRHLAAMKDPSPGKSGIVRDRALRDRLRKCLRDNGLNPDQFTSAEIKKLVGDGTLTMASGVPIKSVVLLRTIADPVVIPRKKLDADTGKMVADMDPNAPQKPHPRSKRVYVGGNNHHIEIRQKHRKRKGQVVAEWAGQVVSTFDAAKRVRIEKRDAVDRCDNDQGRFILSLAIEETIYVRRKDRPEEPPDYYVVCKLDKEGNSFSIHFAPHWDAQGQRTGPLGSHSRRPHALRPRTGQTASKSPRRPLGGRHAARK